MQRTTILGTFGPPVLGATIPILLDGAGNADTQFATYGDYEFLIPFIGNTILTIDGEPHTMQRKLITPAFHSHHTRGAD